MPPLGSAIRRVLLAGLTVYIAALYTLTASAQSVSRTELAAPSDGRFFDREVSPAARMHFDDEARAIDHQSSVATGLYIAAAVAMGISGVLELTAVYFELEGGTLGPNAPKPVEVFGGLGGVVGAIGAIALPFAIALHVDAHSRRDALRYPRGTRLSIGLCGVSVSLTF